jgi:zinc D-Ala-D-Ala carboxypeptidase
MSKWKYFTEDEVRCKCGCGEVGMDENTMLGLDQLRAHLGFPLIITSGYRCKAHNSAVGGADSSKHVLGTALDISVNREDAIQLLENARRYGFNGIGVSQKGKSRFIHIDSRPYTEAALWSY